MYADVILPVPLQGLFTYAVPEGMTVGEGMRVLVGFGRSKTYIGLVARVHHEATGLRSETHSAADRPATDGHTTATATVALDQRLLSVAHR